MLVQVIQNEYKTTLDNYYLSNFMANSCETFLQNIIKVKRNYRSQLHYTINEKVEQ